jgi:hypothetical protein
VNGRVTLNWGVETGTMAYFKGLFQHLSGGTEESHMKKYIRMASLWDRFVLRTIQYEAGLLTTEV